MQTDHTNLLARDDTMLGICQAIGEDFGFNPNYLRIVLACLLLWNPEAVVLGYLAAGVLVAISRWIAPDRRRAKAAEAPALEQAEAVVETATEAPGEVREPEFAAAA